MTTELVTKPAGQVDTEPGGQTTLLTPDNTKAGEGEQGKTAEQIAADKAAADKTVANKAVADKTAAEAAANTVPERYDLKVPEGSQLQTADIERLKAEARELGLTNDEAQEYLETNDRAVNMYREAQVAQVKQIHADWAKESEADKEIGGAEFKQNVELGKRVMERFGSPEFKKMLNASGLGNHIEMIRTFVRIGKATKILDDSLVLSGTQSVGSSKKMEDVLYDNTPKT